MAIINCFSDKRLGKAIGCLILTALQFFFSVKTAAAECANSHDHKIISYKLSASATLASAESDTPADPLVMPDYLTPRSSGFVLPGKEELNLYINPITDEETPVEAFVPTVVPQSEAVDDDYFADAVFIGDSRIVGMMTYSGVKSYYYARVSLNIFSVLHTAFLTPPDNSELQLTVLEALEQYPAFTKIYICFGINELGYNTTVFINAYEYFLDRVLELMPGTTVYIQSILPVTAEASSRKRYGVTNEAIARNNNLLCELAEKKGVYFVNAYEKFADEKGELDKSLSPDGIHLGKAGIQLQMDYLRTHTVDVQLTQPAANIID